MLGVLLISTTELGPSFSEFPSNESRLYLFIITLNLVRFCLRRPRPEARGPRPSRQDIIRFKHVSIISWSFERHLPKLVGWKICVPPRARPSSPLIVFARIGKFEDLIARQREGRRRHRHRHRHRHADLHTTISRGNKFG